MTLNELLEEIGATYDGDTRDLSYTVIVVDSESETFHGVRDVRFNHDDRNVSIETT